MATRRAPKRAATGRGDDSMQLKRTTHLAGAIAVGAALTLAGCSSGGHGSAAGNITSTMTPEQAVATAVKNLGDQSSVEMVFSLGLTAAQIQQLGGSGSGGSGSGGPTAAEAQAISSGSIFITASTGHGEGLTSTAAQTDSQRSVDLGLTIGSDTPFEVRYVDQNLYVRAQIQKLLSDVGQSSTSASKFMSEVNSLNSFVPGLSSLAAGDWVEISHASLDSLGSTLKQAAGSSVPSVSVSQMVKLSGQLVGALKTNSTFTSLGSSGGRDEYGMTLNVSGFASNALSILQTFYSSIPVVGSKIGGTLSQAQSKIPAGLSAVTDLYVSGNRLSEADLDANQFKHKYSFAIPVKVVFSSPGAPSSPSGATALDLSKLPSLLGNLLGGLGKTSAGA